MRVSFSQPGRGAALLAVGLVIVLLVSITLAVTLGPVSIAPGTVWGITATRVFGLPPGDWPPAHEQIVWGLRLPRVLLAVVVGGGLAVTGVTMQAAVRNPLADPYLLGLSSGASVGAVAVLLLGALSFLGPYALSLAAFVGALTAFGLVYALARRQQQLTPLRLILAGVAVSYLFSAVTSYLVVRAHNAEQVQSVLFWLLGSLAGAKWAYVALPASVVGGGTVFLLAQTRGLNALLAGEETATALGIDPNRFRQQLLVVAALMTGVTVAVCGAVGFVGLMIPHLVRLVVGGDHRRVVPISLLAGSVFLVWADVLARLAAAPEELPLGIVTAIFGGPFFLWLLLRRDSAV